MVEAVEAYHDDFEAVRRAHSIYLAAMTTKAHLNVRPLVDGIRRLLALCRNFAALFNSHSNAADIPHSEVKIRIQSRHFFRLFHAWMLQVAALSSRFRSDAGYLFLMLERADAKELATRLDYSGWFSKSTHNCTGDS